MRITITTVRSTRRSTTSERSSSSNVGCKSSRQALSCCRTQTERWKSSRTKSSVCYTQSSSGAATIPITRLPTLNSSRSTVVRLEEWAADLVSAATAAKVAEWGPEWAQEWVVDTAVKAVATVPAAVTAERATAVMAATAEHLEVLVAIRTSPTFLERSMPQNSVSSYSSFGVKNHTPCDF